MKSMTFPVPTARQQLDRWGPLIEAARARLRAVAPQRLAANSGSGLDEMNNLRVEFLWREYVVTADTFMIRRADAPEEPALFVQSILLTYLVTADGIPPSDRWISFHDLPDGLFYEQAFQGYSGAELMRRLQGDIDRFKRASRTLNGEPFGIGDTGFAFRVLPRVRLAIAMWVGDEDFPAQARVLFEDTAPHYLSTEGLAVLGGQLVGQLLKAASEEIRHE